MNAENRPPFVTGPHRCGRTEAMLNRVIKNILSLGSRNPDLSVWRIVCISTEHAKNDILPRLLCKLESVAGIKYRRFTESSGRILIEIGPYGPNLLLISTANLDHRNGGKIFYDHAATEWHLREALWQLKEDTDTATCNAPNIQEHSRVKGFKEYFYGALEHSSANKTEGEWQLMPLDKEEIDGKTDDKDKKND